jgi:ornithine--oxo-acid transaminase
MDEWISLEEQYGAHNYHPLPVVLTRGSGAWVWDDKGHKYLDMLSAYSAVSHGHAHPRLIKVLQEQAEKIAVASRAFYTDKLGLFLKQLCEISGMEMALPMNTGAEAVETAIKGARRWGYKVKGIPKDQAEIIVAEGNFHGRTTTIVGFSSEEAYREGFGPFTPGFKTIPFGSAAALEKAITPNTCAFLVEPIQGEAGILMPAEGWLKEVSQICKRHRVLLILDEVQSGLGRTGKMFAFQHEGIQPDGLILGKALGGGLLPVSSFLSKRDVMELFNPGSHGSTFGGNPLAAAVGMEALKILSEERLVEKSAELGAYLMQTLHHVKSPLISQLRGKGLWVGMVIDPEKASARAVCERLMQKGILAKETHEVVVRLAPPLVITQKEIDWAVEQIAAVLKEMG